MATTKNSRNKMYYARPKDREQIRDSDLGLEDSSDPMETDGYGEEEELPGEPDGPAMGFSVPTAADQKDDLAPALGAGGKGLTIKLRKRGMPK